MKKTQILKELTLLFKSHFNWNLSRINFLVSFVFALIKAKSVKLSNLSENFIGDAKQASKYRQIQRFFKDFEFDYSKIALLIVDLLRFDKQDCILSIDRTNWKFGNQNINILVLGIVYKGVAFPMTWICLDKRGNSNTEERILILEKFMSFFGKTKIYYITADREFIGETWFNYLISENIKFCIRIKNNAKIKNSKGQSIQAKKSFRSLSIGEHYVLRNKRKIYGQSLYLVGLKEAQNEFVILATNFNPELAISNYKQRWGIETLFGSLKSKGFNIEETHLKGLHKIEKLFSLVALAFTICFLIGELKDEAKAIEIKKHGRKAVSIFKNGLSWFADILNNLYDKKRRGAFKKIISFLKCKIIKVPFNMRNLEFLSCT